MFIYVTYKDAPELSTFRRSSSLADESVEKQLLVNPDCYVRLKATFRRSSSLADESVEKQLLVNPDCYVRVMLEYIRKKCRLASSTFFDLCDESGSVKGLFNLPTYEYATELFQHKKNYYLIVLRMDQPKTWTILPQVNQENPLYNDLQTKVQKYIQESGALNWETSKAVIGDLERKTRFV